MSDIVEFPTQPVSEDARKVICAYIQSQNVTKISEYLKSGPRQFCNTLSLLKEYSPDAKLRELHYHFIVQTLSRVIEELQAAGVLAIECCNFVPLLKTCSKEGTSDGLKEFVKGCVEKLGFHPERKYIPQLASFYQELCQTNVFPPHKTQITTFDELLVGIKEVVDSAFRSDHTEYSVDILISATDGILDKINSYQNELNFLERAFIDHYHQELTTLKKDLMNEKKRFEEDKKQKAATAIPEEEKLKYRVSFMKNEKLPFEETEEDEYKDYSLPFNEHLEKSLKKEVCAFLNRRGGRIYIGVNDKCVVKGMKISYSQRKELYQILEKVFASMEPQIPKETPFKVMYIPVKDPQTQQNIKNLYVIKVIVPQGDPTVLYSVSEESLQCYIRHGETCTFLSSRETREYIISRFMNPGPHVPDEEFDDPDPEKGNPAAEVPSTEKIDGNQKDEVVGASRVGEDILSNRSKEEMKSDTNSSNNEDSRAPKIYYPKILETIGNIQVKGENLIKLHEVFVEGLPLCWTQSEFDEFADALKFKSLYSKRMFRSKHGGCNGKAYFNFQDEDEAQQFINVFNGSNLCGKTLLVKFKNAP